MDTNVLLAIVLTSFLVCLIFILPAWIYSGQLVPKMRSQGKHVSRSVLFIAVLVVMVAYLGGTLWGLWQISMTNYQGFLFLMLIAVLIGVVCGTVTYFLIAQLGLLPPITLGQLAIDLQSPHDLSEARKKGKENMLLGVVILLFGLSVTVGTWKTAQQGGTYAILYGAIFIGVAQILKGFSQYRQK